MWVFVCYNSCLIDLNSCLTTRCLIDRVHLPTTCHPLPHLSRHRPATAPSLACLLFFGTPPRICIFSTRGRVLTAPSSWDGWCCPSKINSSRGGSLRGNCQSGNELRLSGTLSLRSPLVPWTYCIWDTTYKPRFGVILLLICQNAGICSVWTYCPPPSVCMTLYGSREEWIWPPWTYALFSTLCCQFRTISPQAHPLGVKSPLFYINPSTPKQTNTNNPSISSNCNSKKKYFFVWSIIISLTINYSPNHLSYHHFINKNKRKIRAKSK